MHKTDAAFDQLGEIAMNNTNTSTGATPRVERRVFCHVNNPFIHLKYTAKNENDTADQV